MSVSERPDLPTPRKPASGSAGARAAERVRLTQAAMQMRGVASETATTALTALLDLAQDTSGAAHLHGMASVIAGEVCQRARNVDREVAHLIAGLEAPRAKTG
jgi:hypothetical protein